MQLIWHIGNRHIPCEIKQNKIFIQNDAIIKDMIKKLGGKVRAVKQTFAPEGGAYGLEEPIVTNINKKKLSENVEQSLQILQTWFSPSFPIGSFSFSHGLEALIEDKLITNKQDILDYLNCILFMAHAKMI